MIKRLLALPGSVVEMGLEPRMTVRQLLKNGVVVSIGFIVHHPTSRHDL